MYCKSKDNVYSQLYDLLQWIWNIETNGDQKKDEWLKWVNSNKWRLWLWHPFGWVPSGRWLIQFFYFYWLIQTKKKRAIILNFYLETSDCYDFQMLQTACMYLKYLMYRILSPHWCPSTMSFFDIRILHENKSCRLTHQIMMDRWELPKYNSK